MVQGEYYLHENGSLIYKPHGGVDQSSTFVKRVWDARSIGTSQYVFVSFLKEAYKAGANKEDIQRMADKNSLSLYAPGWEEKVYEGKE